MTTRVDSRCADTTATNSTDEDIRVAAIDFLEMAPLPGVSILQLDFLDPDAQELEGTQH